MSKIKKLVAGALAAVICTTTLTAPAKADAATYCSHNIYKAGTLQVGTSTSTHKHEVTRVAAIPHYIYNYPSYDVYYTYHTYKDYVDCKVTTNTYRDIYACYKCSYSYMGGVYSGTSSHNH